MSKKISIGKISFASKKSTEDTADDNKVTGFGKIDNIDEKKPTANNDSTIHTVPSIKNTQKQAKQFDVELMMNEFNEKVEKTKISEINSTVNEEGVDNQEDDMSRLMGFTGFGKVRKPPNAANKKTKNKPAPAKPPENTKKEETKEKSDSDDDDDDVSDDEMEGTAESTPQLPITHEIRLDHSIKAVSGLALDPAGARLVTGSQDFDMKFWDFNAMDSRFQSFRTIQPMENYLIRSIEYSNTGDLLLVSSGGPQAKVLDRDGSEVYECRKGDQYIVDMTRTNGHVSALYNAVWHPKERRIFMTSSSDCTVRLWDISVTLNQQTVIKLKGRDGKKVSPTHAVFNKDASMIAVATIDGALSIYPAKGPFIRARKVNKAAHLKDTETSCLKFAADGYKLLSRGGDDTMKLWDVRNLVNPVYTASGLGNVFVGTDCWFSPDLKMVMTGTSVKRGSGELVFYNTDTFNETYRYSVGETSVSKILWHPKLNQIVVGCSNGKVKVYYSPELSSRGALLCAAKQRRRQAKNDEIPTGLQQQIINPYSLPMFREERFLYAKRRKDKARKNVVKSAVPDKPAYGLDAHKTKGCSLSAFVSKQLALDVHGPPAEEEDPRDALLRHAGEAEKNPYWIAPAYGPETKNVYQEVTEESLSTEPPPKKPMYFYQK